MKTKRTAWQRLVVAARQAPVAGDEAAPYGFSTRVAALALAASAERPTLASLLNRFSWRALSLSLLLMALSIVANYSPAPKTVDSEQDTVADPIEEILSLS